MSTLLEQKKQIAQACQQLVEIHLHNEGKPFDRNAPSELVNRRAEALSVIRVKTDAFAKEGGIVLNYTFDLPSESQVSSGAWSSFVHDVVEVLEGKGLAGNYELISFNEEKGLNSVFFDEKAKGVIAEAFKDKTQYGAISLLAISNETPVFKEFGLAYLGYLSPIALASLRLKIESFIAR